MSGDLIFPAKGSIPSCWFHTLTSAAGRWSMFSTARANAKDDSQSHSKSCSMVRMVWTGKHSAIAQSSTLFPAQPYSANADAFPWNAAERSGQRYAMYSGWPQQTEPFPAVEVEDLQSAQGNPLTIEERQGRKEAEQNAAVGLTTEYTKHTKAGRETT